MPTYGTEPENGGRRREFLFAGAVILAALSVSYLGEGAHQSISSVLQGTLLRPFLATQEIVTDARRRAGEVDALAVQLDSLTAVLSTHGALMDENRTLRELLGLAERGGPTFLPATVLRPRTAGSQSMFIVDVGERDGVRDRAAVISAHGLVGVIYDVRADHSVGMDWSHPDFRASGMLEDGTTYGMISRRAGLFTEDDRLILQGTAYSMTVSPGTVVLTSGLGAMPRGIPVGKIERLLDAEGAWRKSYWIQPMVEPGSATHVLVLTEAAEEAVSGLWPFTGLQTREESISDGADAVADSAGAGESSR